MWNDDRCRGTCPELLNFFVYTANPAAINLNSLC